MKKIKTLLDFKKVSVFLIALPYLTFNFEIIISSPFYSFTELIMILSGLLFIDVFVKWALLKLNYKLYKTLSLFIVFISILFFYGFYLTIYIQKEIQDQFLYLIRGRIIIESSLAIFILLIFILKNKCINFKYVNVFLIILSLITIFTSVTNTKGKRKEEFKSSFVSLPLNNNPVKPILLIISDEYTSPDDLYQIYKDSNIYEFSSELVNKGWIAKNSFYSYETSTIHSLSSLFNFNLSKNKNYSKEKIANIGASKLANAIIADSLEKKKVAIINFGIFHIGKKTYLNRLYPYPNSFFEDVMLQTIYYTVKYYTGNFNESGLAISYFPFEKHNKYIFNHLVDTLSTINQPRKFIYAHLFMPHSPLQYNPSFPIRTLNNLNNYKAYWNFTNQKLNQLLTSLIKENKYRIILTGDHGYRGDKRINPHYTFSAFYGFNRESIDKVQTVQDLGSLIYCGF